MAINVSGSKTLTKLSLGSSLTVDISHNYNLFQIYDPNTNAFVPDWSTTDTPLNLKAIVYYNGKDVTSEATYEWTSCYDSSSEVSSVGTNKVLAINTNILQGHTSITYTVKVTYNKLTTTNDITFTLINAGKDGQNGGEAAEHFVSISGEQIFKYDKDSNVSPASITLTATTKNVTISKWYYLNGKESVDLNNDSKATIIINPTDACFIGNQALIKVTTNYADVFDIYNLAKLYDGTNGTNGKNGSTVTVTQKEGITTITTTDSDGKSTSVDVKDGEDGTPGSQGADGKTPFFHIKYSNDGGKTFTDNNGEAAGDYIGQYTDYEATDSSDVGAYTWSKIKGDDGKSPSISISKAEGSTETIITTKNVDGTETSVTIKDGEKGTPGDPGDDGKTPFIHVKYSADGKTLTPATDTAALGETPSDWLGQYTDYIEDDSDEFSDYKWTKIKGEDGTSAIQYYNWVKYANSATPTEDKMYDTPTDTSGNYYSYIGLAYNKDTSTESGNYEDYKWTKIKGNDGDTYYTWIVYAKDDKGAGISATWSDGYEYMAIKYNQKVSTPDLTATDYVWKKFIGDNGVSSYFWTLYADDDKGTNTSSTYKTGYNYIGTCVTTTNEAPATSKYSWVKFIGDNGESSYIHYAYAKDDKGNSFSTTFFEDATYIGVYKSTDEKDSGEYSDYKWKKFVGDDAPDITATKNTDGSVTLKIGDEVIGIDKGKDGTAMQTFYRYANSIPVSDTDLQDTSKVSESPSYTDNGTIKYYSYIGQAVATATAGADITAPTSLSAWKWSYFKGEKGDDGSDAYSAILSNMNMSFRVDKDNKVVSAIKETCDVTVYKGTSSVAFTLGNLPDGITSPAESNSNNSRTLTISIAKGTLLAASGTFTIPISEPIVTNLEIKWTTIKDGATGRGVSSITNYYCLSDSNEPMGTLTSLDGWDTSFSNPTINKRYLWNCEYIKYTDNTNFITTPAIINSYAQDGKSIKSITEEYVKTSDTTTPTESSPWSTDIPVLSNGEYLWKQETITYEQTGKADTSIITSPVMIGYSGVDGKSITGVINYYLASANGSGIVKDGNTWYTDPSKTNWNTTNKYLWNYEEITYSIGNSSETSPCIIGTYAADGKGINSITEEYAISAKAEEPAESEWNSKYLQPTDDKPFVWNKQTIKYTTGDPTVTSRIVCVKGVDGVNGGRWYSGTVMNGGAGTTQVYTSSGITSAVIGDMYFNTSTNDTYRCITAGDANTAKWTYVANIKGKQGDPGADAYYLTLYTADGTIFDNGTGKLTVKANFYQGTTLLSGGTYSWTMTKMGNSGFDTAKITETGDTITVSASDVTGYTTITCSATKDNISRTATVSLTDKTDGFVTVKELPTTNINSNAIYLITSDSAPKLYRRNANDNGWVLITDINTVNSFISDTKTRFSKLLTDDNKLALNFNFANPQASTVSTEGIHLVGEKGTFNVDNSQLAFYDENNVLRLGFGTTESGSTSFQVKGNVTAEKFIATTNTKTYNDDDTKLAFTVDGGTMSFAKTLLRDDNNEEITDPTAEKLLWYENGNLNIKGAITASSLEITGDAVKYFNSQAKEALSDDLDTINKSITDIQIGGRNLLRNSNFANNLDSWDDWGTTSTKEIVSDTNNKKWCSITGVDTAEYQGICQKITFIKNTPLILSFSAYSEVEETPFRIIIHQMGGTTGNDPQIANSWTLTTTPTRYKVSFTSTDDSSKSTFNLMFGPSKTTNKVYITDIKFEQGNKVTDWSPAPEDVDDGITEAQSMASDTQTEIGTIYDIIRDNINEPLSKLTQHFNVTPNGEAIVAAYEGNTEVASVKITSTSMNISLKGFSDIAIYGPDYIKLGKMKIQALDNKGLIFSTWQ